MRVDYFKLTNFRCFSERAFTVAPQFNLVVGNNATGKTTILDAFAILASGVVVDKGRTVGRSRPIKVEEVRHASFHHGNTLTMEPQLPCTVEARGAVAGDDGSWAYTFESENRMVWQAAKWVEDRARDLHREVKSGEPVTLPLVCYFGTERLWIQASEKKRIGEYRTESRLSGYKQCLNPASNETRLLDWFRDQEFASLQQATTLPTLEACRKAIATCVPGSKHVYFDASLKQLVMELKDSMLPMNYLSDGYRNMLSMVADIAIRCATLNPQFGSEATQRTPGIVLIDELDLHLHPKWQRQVVTDLMKAFPEVQFVATTHSPFVIQSLPPGKGVQLINLDEPGNQNVQDKSVEDIAELVQGVELPQRSQRYLQMMNKAQQYFEMLKDDANVSPEDKQAKRKELEELVLPYSDSPAYHAFIKMQELAAQKEAKDGGGAAQGGSQ